MSKPSNCPRIVKAAVVVCLLVAVAPLSKLLCGVFSCDSTARLVDGGIDAAELVAGIDPFASLGRLEKLAGLQPSVLPRYFEEEVGLPEGAREIRVNSDGSIVGYVVQDKAESVHQLVSRHMASFGWSEVELGAAKGSTYLKESGSCRWGMATFTQVGPATSVVFRCVVS